MKNIIIKSMIAVFIISLVVYGVNNEIDYKNKVEIESQIKSEFDILFQDDDITGLALYGDTLWCGGRDGVYHVDTVNLKNANKLNLEEPLTYVRSIFVNDNGLLYAAHENGLTEIDTQLKRINKTYTVHDGLPGVRVNWVMEDSKERLWVGTWDGAVCIDSDENMKYYTIENGLLHNMVNVILEDKDGGMWFGSYIAPHGGVSYLKDGKWQYFDIKNGLPHANVTSILQDGKGRIWVGTGLYNKGGAACIDKVDGKYRIVSTLMKEDGLAGEKVRYIFEDSDGWLFYGSEYDGLAIFKEGIRKVITIDDGLSDNEIKFILPDRHNNLWFATRKGLTRVTREKIDLIKSK